ncbi:hypothetical protein [Paenibacillus sp. HW567]|uniref:hypothetical protein n=1 Tax=Paenibacillus sp. HW567 TaxID=1034769 RepID=UPI00036F9AE7|nr:hypothetical protein [Paenibacillus sp. HW567]
MSESVLTAFYEYGLNEGLFELQPIKDLAATACTSLELEVIDFDKTKERVSEKLRLAQQPKSCDALKIIPQNKSILFIEMKSFKKFKRWMLLPKSRDEHESIIVKQIKKYNIAQKIHDSIMILDQIWKWSGVSRGEKLEIQTIILTDIPLLEERNSEALIDFTLLYLADGAISEDLLIQAKILQALENLIDLKEKPLLKTCNELPGMFK